MYYHFYYGNLHIATAHGNEEATDMLAKFNSEWSSLYHVNWSDDGDVELSKYKSAPKHNDLKSMRNWRMRHPEW